MTDHDTPAAPLDPACLDEAARECPGLREDLLRLWAEAAQRYADVLDPRDPVAWAAGLHTLKGAAALVGAREVLDEAAAARLTCDVLGRSAAKARLRAAAARSARAAWRMLGLGDLGDLSEPSDAARG